MDTINVLVSGNDLTAEEFNVVLTALRTHYEMLNETPQGDRGKAAILLSASKKLGFASTN